MLRLLTFFILLCCSLTLALEPAPDVLLPDFLKKTPLKQSLSDFQKLHPDAKEDSRFEHRREFEIDSPEKNVVQVTFYFDARDDTLYEYIIEYDTAENAIRVGKELFGEPNNDEDWAFEDKDGREFRAWQFATKLVITEVTKGGPWDGHFKDPETKEDV